MFTTTLCHGYKHDNMVFAYDMSINFVLFYAMVVTSLTN